ncbi:PspA/IM30 family protein [Pelagibaculum spongiae]|uniref:Phage shock protein PspA n=1 Tax=Pelagibaculum spongiae TaxID=2080658 RepID=A0A2V1GV47_9GAMM|nr:PspA/IM30 family protein [Pelagibaculum spongiae]PVZ70275.1 phage shock protein PspA [Pelagibaculum spongiae]
MSIFSRLSDILSSNISSILDRAEDPEKMARLMLQEMEETLVEVRTDAARLIAQKKELQRQVDSFDASIQDWTDKASLALQHQREDLARKALAEKQSVTNQKEQKNGFLVEMEQQLTKHDEDITRLQNAMDDARKRLESIRLREQVSSNRVKMRQKTQIETLVKQEIRFEQLEKGIDAIESQLDSQSLGKKDIHAEFEALQANHEIEKELEVLKKNLAKQ